MNLVCTFFTVKFFPAAWPSEAGGTVLLAQGAAIDARSPLLADLSQLVETANFVRGEVPDFYVRGGRTVRLRWEEAKKFASPGAALADGLARQEAMPMTTGWASLEIPELGRAWVVSPVAFAAHRTSYNLAAKTYRVAWELLAGAATEVATNAPDDAWLWEDGTGILWEDGDLLALEGEE